MKKSSFALLFCSLAIICSSKMFAAYNPESDAYAFYLPSLDLYAGRYGPGFINPSEGPYGQAGGFLDIDGRGPGWRFIFRGTFGFLADPSQASREVSVAGSGASISDAILDLEIKLSETFEFEVDVVPPENFFTQGGVWSIGSAAPQIIVTNVRSAQRPDTMLVDIFYDLEMPEESDTAMVSVEFSINGGNTYAQASSVTGEGASSSASAGTNRHLVWHALTDQPDVLSEQAIVRLTATSAEN